MDFHQSKNVIIKSCQIYRKDQNDCFILDFWISHQSKYVTIKSCHIYKKDNVGCFILAFLDQICPNLIKLDQNGFSPIKKCYYKKLSHLQGGSK